MVAWTVGNTFRHMMDKVIIIGLFISGPAKMSIGTTFIGKILLFA